MIPQLFTLLILGAAIVAAWLFLRSRRQRGQEPPLIRYETWIYIQTEKPPTDDAILRRMTAENPHQQPAADPIGTAEGVTFSDVRFHIGLMMREKNALLFRPDMWAEPDVALPKDVSDRLAVAKVILNVKFIAEEAVSNRGYLQFVAHAVDAIADLTDAVLIFDVESQVVVPPSEYNKTLAADNDATRFDANVVTRIVELSDGCSTFTRGMNKVGLPDILAEGVEPENRTLAKFLVENAARRVWDADSMDSFSLSEFGEDFKVEFGRPRFGSQGHRGWVVDIDVHRLVQVKA